MSNEIVRTQLSDYKPETPIDIRVGDQIISLSVVKALEMCVPSGTTPADTLKFLLFCRANRLDPIMGDVCLVPRDGRHIPVVLKAGWLRKLIEHPLYEGHEAGIIVKGQNGTLIEIDGTVHLPEDLLFGGWARIHLKGRRPFYHSVQFSEYSTGKSTWAAIPRTMIRKVAFVQAVRECILLYLGGYDQSEVATPEVGAQASHVVPPDIEAEYEEVEAPNLSPGILSCLQIQIDRLGATQEEVAAWCRSRKVSTLAELSDMQGADLLRKLESVPSPGDPDILPSAGGQEDATQEEGGQPTDEAPAIDLTDTLFNGSHAPPAATLDRDLLADRAWRKTIDLAMTQDQLLRLFRQFEGMDQGDPSWGKLSVPQLIAFDCFLDDQLKHKDADANWPGVPDSISGNYLIPPATRPTPEPKKRGRPKKTETATA